MSEEKLRNKLWDIVNKEFNDFKNEQLQNSKEEIFENAYKISTLSDFVDMCDPECGCLKIDEVKALIKEKYPAHTLYNFYMKSDAGGISDLYESICILPLTPIKSPFLQYSDVFSAILFHKVISIKSVS